MAPLAAQRGRSVSARVRRSRLGALEALEGGFALFRSTFGREAWRYYAGALPLAFCFIPTWVFNGQVRVSSGGLLMEALIFAGAYLLRVWAIARYMQGVRERAFGVPLAKRADRASKAAALGRLLAWKITLSAGALATLFTVAGASWFYGACQFASLEALEDSDRAAFHSRLRCACGRMVRRRTATFSDAFPSLDCRVAELHASGASPAATAALYIWVGHTFVDANGRLLAS